MTPQADAEHSTGTVLNFPTKRRKAYRQSPGANSRETWPPNVRAIREPRPTSPLPPSAFLVLAFVQANGRRKSGACLMDVQDELSAMMERFKGDLEVQAGVYNAMSLLWAGRTGRW